MASVTELDGRFNEPLTYKFVLVALVIKPLIITVLVAKRLVVVALVNTAVEATLEPIGVLLTVPPSIVRPFTTITSVTELFGKFSVAPTLRLVILALVILELTKVLVVNTVLVLKFIAPLENCMRGVPVTEVPFR